MEWVDEAKVCDHILLCWELRLKWECQATYAFYSGDIYHAYELYIRAKAHQMAHELAITYLAPEAVLRDELELLAKLFRSLDPTLVDDFGVGGQVRTSGCR